VTDTRHIKLCVNDTEYARVVETRLTLADFLRHDIGLTGTHIGCEHGVCGACTILVNGRTSRSCLMLAVQANGHEIRTVEGLAAADGTLSPLQQAFWEMHALQCGFCTSGMLMTLTELLATNQTPSESEIRERIAGNICRCTGYQSIIEAALLAAERLRQGREIA
jgi:aerobic-type carbon monoxide dehydrogenase small subunit (CoxS/CutS family)